MDHQTHQHQIQTHHHLIHQHQIQTQFQIHVTHALRIVMVSQLKNKDTNHVMAVQYIPDPCNPCIKNCDGKPAEKQRYQSCNGCTVYATCENGKFTDNIPCCEEKHFDDNLKQCVKPGTSSTCPYKGRGGRYC